GHLRPRHPAAPYRPDQLRGVPRARAHLDDRATTGHPRPGRPRPARVGRPAGYPGTSVVPAISWIASLLALKLTGTRRVTHVDDLISDPASALFAGLMVLPKKTALTDYSYRLSHDQQRAFLTALDTTMISSGLASGGEAIFDLDFHAVMHW